MALLRPSTEYKLIMYSNGSSSNIHSFTTEAEFPNKDFNMRLSSQNFKRDATGKFQVPFVFSWKLNIADNISVLELSPDLSPADTIASLSFGVFTVVSAYSGFLTQLGGDETEGAALLYTAPSNKIYRLEIVDNNGITYLLDY